MVSPKMLFVLFVVVVSVFSVVLNAAAAEKVVRFGSISPAEDDIVVNLEARARVTDSRVIISFPESGLSARRNVDFSRSGRVSVHIGLPDSDESYVRIVFSSDQGRRVKYRPLQQ